MRDRRYRGKRGGLSAGQIAIAAVTAFVVILFLTMEANSQWTGQSVGEQVHQALFVAKDWE